MARPAERDQGVERVRLHAFGVVDMQICPRATLPALHAVSHFCPKSLFGKTEGFGTPVAADPYGRRVDTLIWAACSLRMVVCRRCVAGHVGVREARFTLLPVALAVEFLSGGEPLVHFLRVTALVYLCVPTDSAMEPLGFASGELSLVTSLMLLPQPVEVAEPCEGCNVFDVRNEARVPIVFGPAPHDSVQGRQSVVLVHPRPVPGSQVFELPFHSLLGLGRRSEMHRPLAIGPLALDMETQEVEAIVDVGDNRLFFR